MKSVVPPTPATRQCWWCGGTADSGEHKFKRSDLVREHGQAPYTGPATLVRLTSEGSWDMRSSKSGPLKFQKSLCASCNNTRSQPFDAAYDEFIQWLLAHEENVFAQRQVDLVEVFGSDWETRALDLYRYFLKHVGCRIADSDAGVLPASNIVDDLVTCLDGGGPLASLACGFFVEPAMLRFCEMGDGDPLWVRPFGMDDMMFTKSGDQLDVLYSTWRYGWLTFGWTLGPGADGEYPFAEPEVALPIVAASWDPLFEFALARGRYRDSDEDEDVEPDPADQIDPGQVLDQSPVGFSFMVGALDFEANTRGVQPDERRNESVQAKTTVAIDLELRRATMLISACQRWAEGDLDGDLARWAAETAQPQEPAALNAESERMQAAKSNDPAASLRTEFACMATLKLAEALIEGVDTEDGQDALLDAARFAGCSAMSAAFAVGDAGGGFENVAAVAAAIARA
jgi:hypothetical protein